MKKTYSLLLCLFFNFSFSAQNQTIVIPDVDYLQKRLNELQVPAVGIGIIEDGVLNSVLVKGQLKEGIKAPYNSIFNVASLTKSITTILTMKLVDEGLWELDNPLSDYWVDPDVKNEPYSKILTTRHILSHQSGFSNWRNSEPNGKLRFNFKPGTKFGYSGEGFEYLRKAIENKFKRSFDALVKEYIFEPLSMNDSYLTYTDSMGTKPIALDHKNLSTTYPMVKSKVANAADDLYTSVADLGKFGCYVINGFNLTKSTFNKMITPQVEPRPGVKFGLGWVVFENLNNNEYALFNAGSDQGVNSIILLLPKSKRGILVFTNGDGGRQLVMELIGKLLSDTGQEILSKI